MERFKDFSYQFEIQLQGDRRETEKHLLTTSSVPVQQEWLGLGQWKPGTRSFLLMWLPSLTTETAEMGQDGFVMHLGT